MSFQHAQAVGVCLDCLESERAGAVRVEGTVDIIDYEVCDADGGRIRVGQAKTRKDPHTWSPSELLAVIRRWQEIPDTAQTRFEFVTDGSSGPELADELQPALRRAAAQSLTDEDRQYLAGKGLNPDDDLLSRLVIRSRQPEADALLEIATLRVLRLFEIGRRNLGTASAADVVNKLFRIVSIRSGNHDPAARLIAREELAELVGVSVAVIDSTRAWDSYARALYVAALKDKPPDPAFVMLDAEQFDDRPVALALVVRERVRPSLENPQPEPATVLLETSTGAVLGGQAGAGKTTTLEMLIAEAVGRDLCPILVSVAVNDPRDLEALVRDVVEAELGYQLNPAAIDSLLDKPDTLLFVDGVGELQPEVRQTFVDEILRATRAHPRLRVVTTSRTTAALRSLNLPSFLLRGLDAQHRRQIAAALLGTNNDPLVLGVEQRLDGVVDNPLLFVMALSLARDKVLATTRAELFDGFVDGIVARKGGEMLTDLVLALIRDACFQLRSHRVFGASRWEWLSLFAAALERFEQRRMFAAGSVTADEAIERALAAGLLRTAPRSSVVVLTHDLFCDYFAAESIRFGQHVLPKSIPEELEEVAVLTAERGLLSAEEAELVATNPVAAVRCAAAEPSGMKPSESDANSIFAVLSAQLGQAAATRAVRLRLFSLNDHLFVAVVPASLDEGLDVEETCAAAAGVVMLSTSRSSLGVAVAVWLDELRHLVRRRDAGSPLAIPTDRRDLCDAVAQSFVARKQAAEDLLTSVCPGFADRAIQQLGFAGFHATVGPAARETMPFGIGEVVHHGLVFSLDAPDVSVVLTEDAVDGFVSEPATLTSCEPWLHDSPTARGHQAAISALGELLPGFET